MKLRKYIAVCAGLAVLGLLGGGCQTHTTTIPLQNGFEEISHPHHTLIDEPDPPRISLLHRETDGTVEKIWPSLYTPNTVIKSPVVLFAAEKAYVQPERETHARLFAFTPPGLPLDLTDEVLWRWCKANGRDFNAALQRLTVITPADMAGAVTVHLEFWAVPAFGQAQDDWPDTSSFQLNWSQIDEIMQRVKAKGTVEKDLRWHTEFIGEKF